MSHMSSQAIVLFVLHSIVSVDVGMNCKYKLVICDDEIKYESKNYSLIVL